MAIHTEHFLQAFISASCDKGNLFEGETRDKEKLKMSFHSKLSLSKKLLLPEPTFDAFSKLNSERNSFAHNIEKESINDELINKFETCADSLKNGFDKDISDQGMHVFNSDGTPLRTYTYGDKATPNRVRVLISLGCLISRSLVSLGLNPRHAYSTVAGSTLSQVGPEINRFPATLTDWK